MVIAYVKRHLGSIILGFSIFGIAFWLYGKRNAVSLEGDMIPYVEPQITYPKEEYPLFIARPSVSPIWQNLDPYPMRIDYPFPSTTEKLNLPAFQGH